MKPRAWARGDVCVVERYDTPTPKRIVCIITAVGGHQPADTAERADGVWADLVSVYPSGLEISRRISDLKTVYANTLRRAIAAIEREQAELANRRRLVKLELDLRKKR